MDDIVTDIFRNLPLRFIGGAFGLAEAAKYGLHTRITYWCNAVGTVYLVSHVGYQAMTTRMTQPVLSAICFEAVCSVIVPRVLSYYICGFIADRIWNINQLPFSVRRSAPLVAGAFLIPLYILLVEPSLASAVDEIVLPYS